LALAKGGPADWQSAIQQAGSLRYKVGENVWTIHVRDRNLPPPFHLWTVFNTISA
jgi:hypothetical protein